MVTLTSEIGCIKVTNLNELPETILDLGSLTVVMNNQGFWVLNVSIFSKLETFISVLSDINFDLNNFKLSDSQTFIGYIKEVTPNISDGSEYIDYKIVGEGVVC